MKNLIAIPLILVIVIAYLGMFQVREYEKGVVLRFDKPVKGITEPGLHFKLPFIDTFRRFDGRILGYDSSPREVYTKDKKNLVLDNYAKWRITDPILFLQKVKNERGALYQLDNSIYSVLRNEIGKYTLTEIVGAKRETIMHTVTEESDKNLKEIGVQIIDVRIKRVDLPKQNEKNVFERMRAERAQQAKKYRAEGKQKAQEIKSKADKESTILLAEAQRKAQEIKGEGDAEALQIYADTYNKDKEFYQFIRTLESYEKILKGKGKNNIIFSTESDLWKYLYSED